MSSYEPVYITLTSYPDEPDTELDDIAAALGPTRHDGKAWRFFLRARTLERGIAQIGNWVFARRRVRRVDVIGHFRAGAGSLVIGQTELGQRDANLAPLLPLATREWLAPDAVVRLLGCGTALAAMGDPVDTRLLWLRRIARLVRVPVVGTRDRIDARHYANGGAGLVTHLVTVNPDGPLPRVVEARSARRGDERSLRVAAVAPLMRSYAHRLSEVPPSSQADVSWDDGAWRLELHLGGRIMVARGPAGAAAAAALEPDRVRAEDLRAIRARLGLSG